MQALGDWERLAACLDDDMRFVYPEFYIENQKIYDKVVAVGYLVKDLSNPDSRLDWIKESKMDDILHNNPGVVVLDKMLIVRLRLPWHEVNTEWLMTDEQLSNLEDDYEILETYVRAKMKRVDEKPHWIFPPERQYFDEHRDEYEITDVRHCVRWKWEREYIESLLDNPYEVQAVVKDKNNVHTYISE